MAHEATISELTELDSDGSSCGERGDARKRLRFDADSSGPKKRRKQTTPVRFSSALMTGMHEESNEEEDEDEDSEGKLSPQSPIPSQSSIRDENLNNEFRCQYCSQFFDSKDTLNVHLDNEHGSANSQAPEQCQSRPPSAAIKQEPTQQLDQSENPVNMLSVKDFAINWLATTGPHVQSHTQIQTQNEESWPGPANQIPALSNHLQVLSGFPGALAQYLPMPAFPLTDANPIPRPSLGPTPIRIFNPDAYCDLCNKEFCNKYFLKTHKANKHGIYVDSPGPSCADNNAPGPMFPSSFPSNMVKLEPPATPPTPTVACDFCQKRFKNEDSMRKHKQKMHSELLDQSQMSQEQPMNMSQSEEDRDTSRDSLGGIETLFKQEYGIEQEDATYVPAPRHLSPHSVQQARDSGFNADRLRRLGVINPEAFCEICCKEYCNKYFLRTHKMKRHGIVVQDSERSPSNPGSTPTWHQVQTSPLNLIVTENPGSIESNERAGDDYECKPCGIRFQTLGLYQAHCRKMHEGEEQHSPKQECELEAVDQRNDSISEDLQKLQTMLLQLNGLKSGKGLSCNVCGKEYESRTALHIHMVTEHAAIGEDPTTSPQEKSPSTAATAFCTLCGKDYANQDALRRHVAEEHQPAISSAAITHTPATAATTTNSNSTSQAPGTGERKVTSMTPTSSYCEICNKELCNKYFMKTHMQRMHGIEIENGAQIGGVICNICNKELCSKYFLRVHKHNTHGIVDESTAASSVKQEGHDATSAEDAALKPEQLGDLSHRYFTHFTEVCPICNRRFRSIKWLKAHLMGDHGKTGIDKWREMEQHYQTLPKPANRPVNTMSKNSQSCSSLKIPNGFEVPQQIKNADYTGLGNQVLSNLLGSSSEDPQLKSYRCSYCNFTTTVLPFLFLHERSHVNSRESFEGEKSLQCPICSQGFHQPEMLHQHLLASHQFPALLSHFPPPAFNNLTIEPEKSNEAKEKLDLETKEDRIGNSSQVTANRSIPDTVRSQRQEDTAVQVTPQGVYKCAQCGYATTNLNRIKKHVKKDHKAIGDPTESVIAELSKTLRDVANRHKMPACYAMPQDMNSNPDKTIMQPFLIEEQDTLQAGEESSSEKRFASALVYLPVKSRISNALTASFTLSPA
ncbi:zinc finger protein 236 [Ceratina calcarata]|uniref:Zinc finger protein 236 n=1 Tax=Ceratina calcarata TaxID=156304 RepID=A0AAJ7JEK4_9HYME|nr:zinc finger protein 236 [Ceratina calcarata]XP_026675056.1 zinc finger protein 236 [Ceratina calcarata]XP_026675063.1 zinc finger protein 236 [Ceratina calcarata]XP_026675067.1 zinc finger protein 236 [Ceratina calcarata]